MAKVIHVYGTVRTVERALKRGTMDCYGSHIGILTEPGGDTLRITAFERTLAPAQAESLVGTDVHAIVGQDQRGNFTDSNLIAIEPWVRPSSLGASSSLAVGGRLTPDEALTPEEALGLASTTGVRA